MKFRVTNNPAHEPQVHLIEALANWSLPGSGYWIRGERTRAIVLGATILSIWISGLLIGGINSINRREHSAWFLGQIIVGPSLAVQWGREYLDATYGMPIYSKHPAYYPSFGRVNEQGVLFTALAGLLNLLTILDVGYSAYKTSSPTPS